MKTYSIQMITDAINIAELNKLNKITALDGIIYDNPKDHIKAQILSRQMWLFRRNKPLIKEYLEEELEIVRKHYDMHITDRN